MNAIELTGPEGDRSVPGLVALRPTVGRVPKWSKGTDCKSVIRGFESHRGLLLGALVFGFVIGASSIPKFSTSCER